MGAFLVTLGVENAIEFDAGGVGDGDTLVEFAVRDGDTDADTEGDTQGSIDGELTVGNVEDFIHGRGPAVVGAGVGVAVDEIEMGFCIGPGHVDACLQIPGSAEGDGEGDADGELGADDKDVGDGKAGDTDVEDGEGEGFAAEFGVFGLETKGHGDFEVLGFHVDGAGFEEWGGQSHGQAAVEQDVAVHPAINTPYGDAVDGLHVDRITPGAWGFGFCGREIDVDGAGLGEYSSWQKALSFGFDLGEFAFAFRNDVARLAFDLRKDSASEEIASLFLGVRSSSDH